METDKIDLGTKTIQNILTYIEEHHLKTGEKLPTEGQWMKTLQCGRSTVREAMQVLAHSGVVEIKQGAGTFVKQQKLDAEFRRQFRSTVKMLENEAIRELTTIDINDDDWLVLKAILSRRNQLLELGKFDEYIDEDLRFHFQIIKMSNNNYLVNWYQQLQIPWKDFISRIVISHKQYRGNTELHDQLFKALVNRNYKNAIEINDRFAR